MGNAYDCVVIGAGPAGVMAGGMSARGGLRCAILEKNDLICKKLAITGGGRCNISTLVSANEFYRAFGREGQFLRTALGRFGAEELKEFLSTIDVGVYSEGRNIFVAGGGRALVEGLRRFLDRSKVRLFTRQSVRRIAISEGGGFQIETADDTFFATKKVVISAGGKSYPRTGSSGDGFLLAERLGHTVVAPVPAMGPVRTRETYFAGLAGVSVPEVRVEVWADGKREGSFAGGLLITHQGISGPAVLDASLSIARAIQKGKSVELTVSFVDAREENPPEVLGSFPSRLRTALVEAAGISTEKDLGQITRSERHRLVEMLRGMKLTVVGLSSWDQAMVTVGGVSLKEVDPQTMESRIVPGLYLAGESLDLAAGCGGYNIQAAFSTGFLAGVS